MLGNNIKIARKNKFMTQEQLAERLDVVRQTVSKWEKNLSVPDADLLEKLADVLDVNIQDLLGKPALNSLSDSQEQIDSISEQLAVIMNQEAYRIRTRKNILKALIIILVSMLVIFVIWYMFGKTDVINESSETLKKSFFHH